MKGRGAQINPANRFLMQRIEADEDAQNTPHYEDIVEPPSPQTKFIEVYPKSILSKVDSPDLPMLYSLNPYQGCEHGCVYCYARNTHEYYGYSAGLDFERIILVKPSAPQLLAHEFSKPSWQPVGISLSGNTDCYQPAERKYRITRRLLQTCLHFGNPVGVITKNALIGRDVDVLADLARESLVHVYFSITTLDESLRRVLEPRTATAAAKLRTIRMLTDAGVPVGVMAGPVIPGLNDHETPAIVEAAANAGALMTGYTVVRLNGAIGQIFTDWVQQTFPDRAAKILRQIADMHGGQLNDSVFGRRMSGQGHWAEMISQVHRRAREKHLQGRQMPTYNYNAFRRGGQLSIF